ncbi:MAG: hypothetical protein ABFQ62_02730 [Patescibacteria group bacterium]
MKTKVKNGIIHVERHTFNKRARILWIATSLLMIVAGAIGLIFVQKPISETQIIDKQASIADGQVNISSEQQGSFLVAEQSEIYLNVNTNGVQTDGVELTFSIVTDSIDSIEVETLPTELETARLEIDATSTGFLVNVAALAPADSSFSNTQDTRLLKLSFTPIKTGSITLNFDSDKSFAPVSNSDPVQDELKHIASMDFQISTNDNGTPELEISYPRENQHIVFDDENQEFCVVDTPIRGNFDGLQKRHSINGLEWTQYQTNYSLCFEPVQGANTVQMQYRNTQSQVSIIYTRNFSFERIGSGGNGDVKQCNDVCDLNSDCPINHICYQTNNDGKRCRRSNNTDSVSCEFPDTDDGLNFSCGEYCSNSTECSSEFICLDNRCKNPDNPDDEFCREASRQIISSNQSLCNRSCTSDSDCAINLSCYYGNCRLKSNPSSTSCSSVRKRIVYKTIYKTIDSKTTNQISQEKGAQLDQPITDSSKSANLATSSATINNNEKIEEEEIEIPYQVDKNETDNFDKSPEEKSALDSLLKNLEDRGFSLSLLMILGGGALIIIVIISSLLGRKSEPKIKKVNTQPLTPQTQKQMSSLEDRIQSLQQSPPPSASTTPSAPPPPNPVATTNYPSMAQRTKSKGLIKPISSGRTEIFSEKS